MPRIRLRVAFTFAALITLPACDSGDNIRVTGRLLKGGTKYEPPVRQKVAITFVALELKDAAAKSHVGENFTAAYRPDDGTFTVSGPLNQGIPRGKYRVSVTQLWTREGLKTADVPKGKKKVDREADILKNRFGTDTSPIVREVDGQTELTIDLDRPDG